jgi:molybdenum cofactor biosynthesis protein B
MSLPHPDPEPYPLKCAILTVSDSRTPESDRSGQTLQQYLTQAGHQIIDYTLLPDEPDRFRPHLQHIITTFDLHALIINGGTGIAPRDTTYDAIAPLLERTLPGFGEIFRMLSYQEVGSRAMASRAIAGVIQQTLIFCLPGSTKAVILAMERLILPELRHLTHQLRQ